MKNFSYNNFRGTDYLVPFLFLVSLRAASKAADMAQMCKSRCMKCKSQTFMVQMCKSVIKGKKGQNGI